MAKGGGGTFACARMCGGMILSAPKACFGSIKEVKIFAHFLHSAGERGDVSLVVLSCS